MDHGEPHPPIPHGDTHYQGMGCCSSHCVLSTMAKLPGEAASRGSPATAVSGDAAFTSTSLVPEHPSPSHLPCVVLYVLKRCKKIQFNPKSCPKQPKQPDLPSQPPSCPPLCHAQGLQRVWGYQRP